MRLKRHDDAAPERPRRRENRGDLGRMMAVVVDDQDAVRLAAHFEAPLGAAKLSQAGGDLIERQPELEADRHGGERVCRLWRPGTFSVSDRGCTGDAAGIAARSRARSTRAVTVIGATATSLAVTSASGESRP